MRGIRTQRLRETVFIFLILVLPIVVVLTPFSPPASAQSGWIIEVVDSGGDTGWETSLALDSRDRPHISYLDVTDCSLKYATWDGTLWRITTVDPTGLCGCGGTSIAIDSQDQPWIAYKWTDSLGTIRNIKLAHWNGSAWVFQVVNPLGVYAGQFPSLALDSQDRPHVAYYSDLGGWWTLAYAAWNVSVWNYETVHVTGIAPPSSPAAYSISLKLDDLGMPRIAYAGDYNLSYFHLDGGVWQGELLDSHPGPGQSSLQWVSLALDSQGLPYISYYDDNDWDLKYAHWNGTNWTIEVVDFMGSVGASSSIALDSGDNPHISYAHGYESVPPPYYLYYAQKKGGMWILREIVDAEENSGRTSSLALDSHDLPHISYTHFNGTTGLGELRHAYIPWVDSEPPVSSVLPVSPYWNGFPIQAVATDESGVANVTLWFRYSTDNSTWNSWTSFSTLSSPPWIWSFTFPGGEGYYEYYSTAADTMGNVEAPPAVTDAIEGYDITPPVSTTRPISPYWHTTPSLTVNATATDNLSGVADVTLFYSHAPLDNSTWTPWTSHGTKTVEPWSWSFSFQDREGHYKFHTLARDVAGNIEGNKTVAEAIAGYRHLPDYAPINATPSPLITTGLSKQVTLSIRVVNLNGSAEATATLAYFNASSPSSPFKTFPLPPISAGSISGPFTATWMSPATPSVYQVSVSVDFYNDIVESDESNNVYTWTVNVVEGPITSLVIGSPKYDSTATYIKSTTPLDFSVTDQSGTGIKYTKYRIDNVTWIDYSSPFLLLGDGDHYVEWYSEDNVGNVESVSARILRVDDAPPATAISIGEPKYLTGGNFVKSSTPLTLSAVDVGGGSNSTFYRLWGGSWSPWRDYSTSFSLAGGDGIWHVEFLSFDYLGNMETIRNETLILDDTPPVTTISPATPFTLAAADSGCGVDVTMYRTDGGSWTVYTGGFTLTEGAHTIYYYSIDKLGNVEQERSLVVRPPVEVAVNYKPVVALVFAVILLVAGVWSSKRRPWKGKEGKKAAIEAFAFISLPFIFAEVATGTVSLLTGLLSIPPLIGVGTAVDLFILLAGVAVAVGRGLRSRSGRAAEKKAGKRE